jgi:hypothetical protein
LRSRPSNLVYKPFPFPVSLCPCPPCTAAGSQLATDVRRPSFCGMPSVRHRCRPRHRRRCVQCLTHPELARPSPRNYRAEPAFPTQLPRMCPRRQEERSQGLRAKRGLPCKRKRERRMEQGDTRESCADTWRQATSAELQSGRCGRVVRSARPFRDAVLVKPGRPPSGRAHVCRLSRHLSRSGCKGAGRRGQSRSDKLGRSGNSGKRPRQELVL